MGNYFEGKISLKIDKNIDLDLLYDLIALEEDKSYIKVLNKDFISKTDGMKFVFFEDTNEDYENFLSLNSIEILNNLNSISSKNTEEEIFLKFEINKKLISVINYFVLDISCCTKRYENNFEFFIDYFDKYLVNKKGDILGNLRDEDGYCDKSYIKE